MKMHPIIWTAVVLFLNLPAAAVYAQTPVLDQYISEGLSQSDVIKQKQFGQQQLQYALDEAKGLALPSVGLNGAYTLAAGGRTISIPVGDMLNPVYSTLNQLTQSNAFPQIENVEEQLSPNNFYDLKIRTTYPLYNPDVRYNKQIKEQAIGLGVLDIAVQQKDLTRDIRLAYFQYMQAHQAVVIYTQALVLARENRRVNQKLYENGMANNTVVIRADNEVSKLEAQLSEVENQKRNAGAYFNFLLNKPLDTPIIEDAALTDVNYPFPASFQGEPLQREELRQLAIVNTTLETALKWRESFKLPRVSAFMDIGSQGFDFQVNDRTLYLIGGLSIDLPLYKGKTNLAKVKQAEMEVAAATTQQAYVADQLALQWDTSLRSYNSALQVFKSSRGQVDSAERYFRDTEKRYREGQALYIEYLDARNELTQAQLQQSVQLLNVWMSWAKMERAR